MKNICKIALLSVFIIACNSKNKDAKKVPKEEKKTIILTPKLAHEVNGLTHCESVVYNKNENVLYASLIGDDKNGDGSIAKISLDGKIINKSFVKGLNDPKGIAITNDKLYVTDVTVLVEADLKTGKVIKKHTTEGTMFLNDVAVASDGNIYVSDTRNSSIYMLQTDGTFSQWLQSEDLEHPNGLLQVQNDMYVAAWGNLLGPNGAKKQSGNLLKVNMTSKEIMKVSKDTLGNLDGVQVYDKDNLVISAWRTGKIMKVNGEGLVEDLLTVGQSVGDILYIPEQKLLALPMNFQSQLLIYKFEEVEE
ncbi:MAG: SMP-30/gluconolactonase/LRE family protein [Kordia sp.]|uniref:SMP-30/gluconolactonase/LRE family protein n=1 Tax=Kordia sp. TaxID=1965332 RepID=UPI00385CD87F